MGEKISDDFLCAGTELFYQNVIHKFWETFSVDKEENCSFKYLGLNIKAGKIKSMSINSWYWAIQFDWTCKFHEHEPFTISEKTKLEQIWQTFLDLQPCKIRY